MKRMSRSASIPVLIAGAGPTGLTLANLLGQSGIRTLLVERNPGTVDIPRAIVIDDEGARTMQAFGAAPFVGRTLEAQGARYYDDRGACFAEVGAGARSYGFAKRHLMHQPELEAALVENLRRFPSVEMCWGTEVLAVAADARGASVDLRTADGGRRSVRAQWLLACDGGRSFVRQALGIGMSGSTYAQDWIVVDTVNDPDADPFSKFFCSAERPKVSVPAPRGGRRYEFMLLPGERRDAMLDDAVLSRLVGAHRPWRPQDVVRRTVYTFHARIAERFRQGRVLLLGDAAHLTPPFAGQGMNAGLRDAHNVAWKVAAVLGGIADESILDTYEEERRGPAWAMIQLAVAMGEIVMPQGREQVAFRDMLLKALEPFPAVRDYLIQMRFKPKPRYAGGLFVDLDRQPYEASLVGEMLPQPAVEADGRRVLLDDLIGSGFALLAQDEAGEAILSRLDHPLWARLKPAALHLRWDADRGARPFGRVPCAVLAEPAIGRPLRTHRDQVLLVRPDRYVAGAFAPDEADAFANTFERMLGGVEACRLSA